MSSSKDFQDHYEPGAEDVTGDAPPTYRELASPDEMIEGNTYIRDDGRIDVNLDSKLGRTLSRIFHATPPHPQNPSTPPPIYTERAERARNSPIYLNIVIQVVGSRGDVQPFVALGTELRRQGHRVRLATHDCFVSFVRGAGLEFYGIGGDPSELMAYMVKNPGLIPNMKSLRAGDIQHKRVMMREILDGCWRSCVDPDEVSQDPFSADAIIANPPSFAHVHCAQALGIPVHLMFTMPWSSTRAFPHPLANLTCKDTEASLANYVSYTVVEWMTWQGLGDVINDWRRKLDLEPVPAAEAPFLAEALKIPFTYCWSPALVPKPLDWPSHIDVCGFFFRDPPQFDPPKDLAAFLDAGHPPVYIGFGSIVIDDPDITAKILSAVRATGVRAVISRGWSNIGEAESTEQVFYIGDCPHEWLFERVAAVVHHGGAGTTACGLRYGKPTTIVPFFGDQPFWGNMIAAAGAGPAPIPHQQLTSDRLADAIRYCLTPGALKAAQNISEKMMTESGVQAAVESFHRNLPLETMACDIIPNQPAAWGYSKGNKPIKLSRVAAALVLSKLSIDRKHMKLYESKTTTIEIHRWDPVTATGSSLIGTATDITKATTGIFLDPYREYRKGRASTTNSHPGSHAPSVVDTPRASSPTRSTSDIGEGSSSRPFSPTSSIRSHHSAATTSTHRTKDNLHTAGKMAAASAKSVGSFNSSIFRGFMVDLPLAAAEGMRNVPSLYGDKPCDLKPVTDWKSGATAAGKNLIWGLAEGMTDVLVQPIKGARKDGVVGAVKGMGKGLVGLGVKTSSGIVGVAGYGGQGIVKSLRSLGHTKTRKKVVERRWEEGDWLVDRGDVDVNWVIGVFERLTHGKQA